MISKKVAAAVVVAALAAAGAISAAPAMAAPVAYNSWTETDDPAPGAVAHALRFYTAASINFGHRTAGVNDALVPLAEVDGLAYTVSKSTSYAPSYQLDVVNKTTKVTYARLVWEPVMQSPKLDDNAGTYKDLEDGLWWANNVWVDGTKTTPFGSVEGSQGKPQDLAFFAAHFGADAKVDFFGLKQGSTTESTSTVSSLTFEGKDVPLDAVDETPFNSKDVDAEVVEATAPLNVQIADLKASLATAKDDAAKAVSEATAPLNAQIAELKDAAVKATAPLNEQMIALKASMLTAQNDAATAKAKIVSISGTKKVRKTVTARIETIAGSSRNYQWYVAGKSVKGATKATLKLTGSRAHHSLSVKIKTSWTDAQGVAHSVNATAKYVRTAYIGR